MVRIFGQADVAKRLNTGFKALTISSNYQIQNGAEGDYVEQALDITATVTNLDVTLPDARNIPLGWELWLRDRNSVFNLKNKAGVLVLVPILKVTYIVKSMNNTTQGGDWSVLMEGMAGDTAVDVMEDPKAGTRLYFKIYQEVL